MSSINLLLFGDQAMEKLSTIQSLVRRSRTSTAAGIFLGRVTDLVQLEFSKLNEVDRAWRHQLHTLLGLAEHNAKEERPNGMIATLLMCIGRLAELMVYAEENPSILGSETAPVEILALCTGLLPAAAAVAAKDTSELLNIGLEIVSVTFRWAAETHRRMLLVEDSPTDWATTLVGVPIGKVKSILDEFHTSQHIPNPRRIAVGVVANGWQTIIGPPSSLKRLFAWSKELDQAAKIPTDINGPIHTSYMPIIDMKTVLGDSEILKTPITSKARLTPNSSRKQYEQTTLGPLLEAMIMDILYRPLLLTDSIEDCMSRLKGRGSIKLTILGPTTQLTFVQRALKDTGIPHVTNEHRETKAQNTRGGTGLVAIVGMAGRFPGSETLEDFWRDLKNGKNFIQKVPKSRFDLDDFFDSSHKQKNSTAAQHGCFLDRPGVFDNRLFNISPREALQMDPIQRMVLTTSFEALESAGYSPNATLSTDTNRIATYFGQAGDDWHEVINNEGIDIYYVPGLARAFGPGRLNYHYKFGGGSYAIDTACSTSTTGVHMACSDLLARECDTALAGGGNLLASPNAFSGLSRAGMISTTGGCRTYHDDADGYVRGEGLGVVVLKRLEDAINDNDNILAVIRGSARAYSSTATSITHPDHKSQIRLYEEILHQTGVDPADVNYVEMHGTGTQAGDAEEMTSVLHSFGKDRKRTNLLTVGAVKANVGHGEAAAGVTSLIKVIMMLKERKVAPQPGLPFKINHKFPPLDAMNVRIAGKNMTLKPRPGGDGVTKVLVNSFDASGGNTSLLVEESVPKPQKYEDLRPYHVVTFSGKTAYSLLENRKRLVEYVTNNTGIRLSDVAYTTTARRMHQQLRKAYTVSTTTELTRLLRSDIENEGKKSSATRTLPARIIFAFTGQGSQYAGMGKDLYRESAAFRAVMLTYQEMAVSQGLPSFLHLISDSQRDLNSESATSTHLAIVALEIGVAHMFKTWGIQPDLVLGHSLGEYAALCVAGVLSVSDTLYLVGQRALLIEKKLEAGAFSMLAVRMEVEKLRSLLKGGKYPSCEVACMNTPEMTVASGPMKEITSLQKQLEGQGSKGTLLRVPYGFHSKQVDPILEEFESIAAGVVFSEPSIPMVSTLKAENVTKKAVFSPQYLARQARQPVNFVGALQVCQSLAPAKSQTLWLEVGPDATCSGLIRSSLNVDPNQIFASLKASDNNWKTLSNCLGRFYEAGLTINWPEYHRCFQDRLTLLDLPRYAFDEKDFWMSYTEPVRAAAIPDSNQITQPRIVAPPPVPGFPTSSLQRVESEKLDGQHLSVTFASNIADPALLEAIRGHVVGGVVICPLSVFGDMALSAASYVLHKADAAVKVITKLSIEAIELTHPLVISQQNPKQIMKITANYAKKSNSVTINFGSVDGKNSQNHGGCQVLIGESGKWKADQSRTMFLTGTRVDALKELAASGGAYRLMKPIVYRLFANLVDFGESYQGLEEIVLDKEYRDAIGTVKFPKNANTSSFMFDPCWMDATSQLAGFIVNAGLKYPDDVVCLSVGCDKNMMFGELSPEKEYTSYCCVQENAKNSTIVADTFLFDGDDLIIAAIGIKFHKMKKMVLKTVLGVAETAPVRSDGVAPSLKPAATTKMQKQPNATQATKLEHQAPQSSDSSSEITSTSDDDGNTSTPDSSMNGTDLDVVSVLLAAVAAECGYNLEEMNDDTVFADLGVDSLMGITINAVLKRETGVELPGTFFMENETLGEAKAALGVSEKPKDKPALGLITKQEQFSVPELSQPLSVQHSPKEEERPNISIVPPFLPSLTPSTAPLQGKLEPKSKALPPPTKATATSRAILLQGPSGQEVSKLFLFPDANGSPASYIQLPALHHSLSIYGLESPFVKDPSAHAASYNEMVDIFLTTLRAQQSHGPYLLGGIFTGALYAYEVARRLIEAGDEVRCLLMLDTPTSSAFKTTRKEEAQALVHDLEQNGLVTPLRRQSKAQKEHLTATIKTFDGYQPHKIVGPNHVENTVFVSSVSDKSSNANVKRWIGGNGDDWEKLVGGMVRSLEVKAEHNAMLREPAVTIVAEQCHKVFDEIISA